MKEATGEGSMTVITIVVIAGILVVAVALVSLIMGKADSKTADLEKDANITIGTSTAGGQTS